MRVLVMTMAYNEAVNLPIWVRHYRAQCPNATLLVLDHGSEDGSTSGLDGVSVLRLPRTPFDEAVRVRLVGAMQSGLLGYHDVVIYTDADEMLVPDPARWLHLEEYLASRPREEVVTPVGCELIHLAPEEPPIDTRRPIIGQRRHALFVSSLCKPLVTTAPVAWAPGFHACDRRPVLDGELYLFHLKCMDRDLALRRLGLTREMAWSEESLARRFGIHQRASDEDFLNGYVRAPAEAIRAGRLAPWGFAPDLRRVAGSLALRDGMWTHDDFRGGIARIPARFDGLI